MLKQKYHSFQDMFKDFGKLEKEAKKIKENKEKPKK